MRPVPILVAVLRNRAAVGKMPLADWDLLLRQARQSLLLGKLSSLLLGSDCEDLIPEQVLPHLVSARIVADRQHHALRAEVRLIAETVAQLETPAIVLKGAAYVLCGLQAGFGRQMADIDLLFPKERLGQISTLLLIRGFLPKPVDTYDRRYYEEWSHELPPATHVKRGTTLDLHHHIVPPTCRLKPDVEHLLHGCRPIERISNAFALGPTDMVLHSASHLFHDGDLEHGLRDIVDLHQLLVEFAAGNPNFYAELHARARDLDLLLPLAYALRYTKRILGTPVPDACISQTEPALGRVRPLMDMLFLRALAPPHASCDDMATPVARWLLYVRSHYLRMPLYMLIPHLLHKAWERGPRTLTNATNRREDCDDLRQALQRKAKSARVQARQQAPKRDQRRA